MTAQEAGACVGTCSASATDATAELLPILKAIADPVRLQIVAKLAASDDKSVCACSMPETFGVSQPTLSHHLKKLVEAEILDREMRGNWAHFSLRSEALAVLRDFLSTVISAQSKES